MVSEVHIPVDSHKSGKSSEISNMHFSGDGKEFSSWVGKRLDCADIRLIYDHDHINKYQLTLLKVGCAVSICYCLLPIVLTY